ncbi:hypothetical protein GALMADRAFT_158867 [Galerina marginata CBS 339.88]|uniref:SMODS and SLOG-associating 2TM effector domain-containing protein n=1 Tax=Galerina marginata (strain CBS 339.88) TaxID=685588 RepID=A0A067SRL0_GALM3|nr:hypothetical protein GALMADRAFT_158867 [Galerina marginata CBS 339.88]
MASEQFSPPVQATPIRTDVHLEPAPQQVSLSQSGDPFRSREGSPRQPSGNIQPSSADHHGEVPSEEKSADGDSYTGHQDRNNVDRPRGVGFPPSSPVLRYPSEARPGLLRQVTADTRMSYRPRSYVDNLHNVPSIEKRPPTIEVRLQDTIDEAEKRQKEYQFRAKWTGYVLNCAIGLQVLLGSLTTGLSAAATNGKSAAVQTTILGALATLVASYLARARGSGEPELSNERVKNLDQFIRETKAFVLDHNDARPDANGRLDPKLDEEVIKIRQRLEVLLGNTTKGSDVRSSPISAA